MTNTEAHQYIQREGEYLLKVIKVDQDRTANFNDVIKVTFQNKSGEVHIEDFVITEKALFKLKLLTKALKMPNVIDTNMMQDRYVKAVIKTENYQKN